MIDVSAWLESGRPIVRLNGVKAPAWLFVVPACIEGASGCGFEHGVPFGPDVIAKGSEDESSCLPDHESTDIAEA